MKTENKLENEFSLLNNNSLAQVEINAKKRND